MEPSRNPRQYRRAPFVTGLLQRLILLLAATGTAAEPATGAATVLHFDLTQAQVVDGRPAPQRAFGAATLEIEPLMRTRGRVDVQGIDAARVTLHAGHAGEAGPVVAEFVAGTTRRWFLREPVVLNGPPCSGDAGEGYYVRVESDAGALRGQVVDPRWQVTVVRLTEGALVPQLASTRRAIAGFAIVPDDGSFYVRLTATEMTSTMRARIRMTRQGQASATVLDLQPSAHVTGVWGSGDIVDECNEAQLPADVVRAYREGRLLVEIDSFDGSQPLMQARLLPPPGFEYAITDTQQRGTEQ